MAHGTGAGPIPTSTYRLQIHSEFTCDDAARLVPYLNRLGISHVFVAPILQATPGSTHNYDVVDHSRVSVDNGGEEGFRRLANALHEAGMGLIVDVVPNHMAVPTPASLNKQWWDVLAKGEASEYWHWFDIDTRHETRIVLPVLGAPLSQVIEAKELRLEDSPDGVGRKILTYHDHVFPVADGTEDLPLPRLLKAQHYRLAWWKVANEELNYRRFFDVTTLAGVRVEQRDVFEKTHETLLRLHAEGLIDGFRIDHPDGLADPRGYLRWLSEATGGAWIVVEKILEGEEFLREDFACAGTTGYDAMWRVDGLFYDPSGAPALTRLWEEFTGDPRGFAAVARESSLKVVAEGLWVEIVRLTDVAYSACHGTLDTADVTRRSLERAIIALLTSMDRYRAYIVPGEEPDPEEIAVISEAGERARGQLSGEQELGALDAVVALATGRCDAEGEKERAAAAEFITRFAQTCGPVHAKSVEDTAFYRYNRFLAVNEVGADPTKIGVASEAFHAYCARMREKWPNSMTTLSTHDTKRSEDVRSRLAALTEYTAEWAALLRDLHEATADIRGPRVDAELEMLIWQNLAGTWQAPGIAEENVSEERWRSYVAKSMREAKTHTTWTGGDPGYEREVFDFALGALASTKVAKLFSGWNELTAASQRAAILGHKLVQLTMTGVPDVYQGNELIDLSLVDPDNRRPVDYELRDAALTDLREDAAEAQVGASIQRDKLRVVHAALTTRREHPEAFLAQNTGPDDRSEGGHYRSVPTTNAHAVAFARSEIETGPARVVSVATRLPRGLEESGGWGNSYVVLDPGTWRDALTGRTFSFSAESQGRLMLADLLSDLPVALLIREDS